MRETDTITAARSPAFIFIFITVLLDMLSIGIIIPVLPKLILSFMGGEFSSAAKMVGIFMSVWAFMQFIASPVMGALSDTWGRRPVILMSNLGLGLDYLIMALAPALWVLFVGRVLAGIFSATVSTAQAYIADITPPEKRAAAFGMLGAAFGLGFVLGPALGGVLGHYDLRLPFFAAAVMSLANFTYGYFILPESLPKNLRVPFRLKSANPVASLKLLARTPQLARLGFIGFLFQLSHHVLPACAVLYMGYRYNWQEREVGLVLAGVGVAAMIVQGGLIRPVVRRNRREERSGVRPVDGRGRLLDLRRRADRRAVSDRRSGHGAVGICAAVGVGADDAGSGRGRARAGCRARIPA